MWKVLSKAPEPDPHTCELPLPDYKDYKFRVNDVIQCKECHQKWVLREDTGSYGWGLYWAKLRWYHFKAQKALKNSTTDATK